MQNHNVDMTWRFFLYLLRYDVTASNMQIDVVHWSINRYELPSGHFLALFQNKQTIAYRKAVKMR